MLKNAISELIKAIEDNSLEKVLKLLKSQDLSDINLDDYLFDSLFDGKWNIAKILIRFGSNIKFDCDNIELYTNELLSWEDTDIEILEILLLLGSDPNISDNEGVNNLHKRANGTFFNKETYDYDNIIKKLFDFGAKATIHKKGGLCNCSAFKSAISHGNKLSTIQIFLSNGADSAILDEYSDDMLTILEYSKEKYTPQDYQTLKTLLNPNNPPYLKLGEKEEDKYIIYENKKTDDKNYEIYLLADKKSHKDKKYLYTDNKIDAFVYWCFLNSLLSESITRGIQSHKEKIDKADYKNITKTISTILDEKITTDWFNNQGKEFATSYLTVTHWWYNLHTDFNRLYQDEEIKLPRAIQSQEEFDTLMKLLDIRYAQFKSGKDFNSNQNKEELEALIEGREPPKRVVDLSFLEESQTIK